MKAKKIKERFFASQTSLPPGFKILLRFYEKLSLLPRITDPLLSVFAYLSEEKR